MAEEYRTSAMRTLPELEVIRMIVHDIAINVMYRLTRQELALVNILPDVKMHRPAVAAKVYHRVAAAVESVCRTADCITFAFTCPLQLDGVWPYRAACMLDINDSLPLADITIRDSNPLAIGKDFALEGRLDPVGVLSGSLAAYSRSNVFAPGNTIASCIIGSQYRVTTGSQAIHIANSNAKEREEER